MHVAAQRAWHERTIVRMMKTLFIRRKIRKKNFMKECYYSVLGVEKKADDDVIKKAYRQMALKHHPDKQLEEDREAATARFQRISEAYEILSDKQERAWYDAHREQILRGDDESGAGSGSHSTKEDIWRYFSTSCFSGMFDDSEGGFYRTYSGVFEELARLERDDFDAESDSDHFSSLPGFGDSKTDWADVQAFFTQWTNFQSSRGFHGFDKWNLRDGENRQIRRLMEVENKKARNAARKEYSSAVRSLVEFVKRRDKRVVEFQTKQAERDRLANEEKARVAKEKEELKRVAREQAREEELRRWAEVERLKQEAGASESCSEDDSEREELVCVACRKTFKSEKAFTNHENSKKHKLEVARLRAQLLAEDAAFFDEPVIESDVVVSPEPEVKKEKKLKQKNRRKLEFSDDEKAPEVLIAAGEEVVEEVAKQKTKPRRRANKETTAVPTVPVFACKRCLEVFQSKSALFRHLDAAGHHALIDVNKDSAR